jgi:hypothetical protein
MARQLSSEDVKRRLVGPGFEADPQNAEEFGAFMASECSGRRASSPVASYAVRFFFYHSVVPKPRHSRRKR